MIRFWDIKKSHDPAFFLPDGSSVNYNTLFNDVCAFQGRLNGSKGLLGLVCTGHYRQYVAYLAALREGCPVVMISADQSEQDISLTLSWLYDPKHDHLRHGTAGDAVDLHPDLALLLSTSGSTGTAKWVRLSYDNIAANAASIVSYLDLNAQDRAPMALPFQYSYGMSIVNSHLAVGGALALTEDSVLKDTFWDMFKDVGCTSLAGVPHSFDLLEKSNIRTNHLPKLRYMTQAGGRLSAEQVKYWATRGKVEGWKFFVMYGQTEAAPRISYLPPDMALQAPNSIGVAVPGGILEVRDEAGRVLTDGAQGELIYQGPNTMMGYAVENADLVLGQGSDVLKTGDIARQRSDGMFEIVGRASRFVKLFGYRIGLDEVENHLKSRHFEAAVVGLTDEMHVFLETSDIPKHDLEEIQIGLARWLNIPEHSFHIHPIDDLPRNENGKINYPKAIELAYTTAPFLSTEHPVKNAASNGVLSQTLKSPRTVEGIYRKYFPEADIVASTTFDHLEGDSLNYLSVTLELEGVLSSLPTDWQKMSVEKLQDYKSKPKWLATLDTSTFIRALAISLIVAGHFELFDYGGGGAFSLLMIIGLSFATFTIPTVIEQESIHPIVSMMARVAVLMFGFTAFVYITTGYGEWPAFFFIGNWISPYIEGSFWFIDVYLQLFSVVLIGMAIPAVRRSLQHAPFLWTSSAAAIFVVVAGISDQLIDTHHLFRRLPHLMAWMFLIGVASAYAKKNQQKLIVTGILFAGLWQFRGFTFDTIDFFLLSGLALIWIPTLLLPRFLIKPVRYVAGASLFIFMTHFKFMQIANLTFQNTTPFLEWSVAMLGGIGIWMLYRPIDIWINRIIVKPKRRSLDSKSH